MLTLDTIMKDTLWVARHSTGYRFVGTYEEVEKHVNDCDNDIWEYIKDVDICCKQPEHLQKFYDDYLDYCMKNEFMIVQDYFNKVYMKECA